jgi:glucose-6-phosphate-specific signal transduction histidine kinase
LNLLTIVESQFKESSITVKIYSLLMEMLQNISKHADNFHQEVNLKPGIFIITENEDKLNLVSGNYIRNNKIDKLKETLNYINLLKQK